MEADWPPRWQLTAPESHVLSYRGGSFRDRYPQLHVAPALVDRGLLEETPTRCRRLGSAAEFDWTDAGPETSEAAAETGAAAATEAEPASVERTFRHPIDA